MKRIMIIGCCGAGKSHLGRILSTQTGIELIYLDKHYWQPAYQTLSKPEWSDIVEKLTVQDSWILDGNYLGTMEIRLRRADTVIFLDRSRWVCLQRILKRTLQYYGRTRPDMAPQCPERFNWQFLQYVYRYNRLQRPKILKKILALEKNQKVFILSSDSEIKEFLKWVQKQSVH